MVIATIAHTDKYVQRIAYYRQRNTLCETARGILHGDSAVPGSLGARFHLEALV